ncbi:MAG TPA: hypothetical protein VG965_02230 [Patescibacteria group bacterium]|nr:hypothetical protein [Patescibacteria group bacterium]
MEFIYIKIADFIIKATFKNSRQKDLYKQYKVDFSNYVSEFIVRRNTGTCDFYIEFEDQPYNVASDKRLLLAFDKKLKNKVTVYYQDYLTYKIILENVIYLLCSAHNGMIIHSSAVAYKNDAYLFTGPSGAGKSTIAELLSQDFTALSDDTSIVRRIDREYFLYQHPFVEKNRIYKSNKRYKLKGIYFIHKSKQFRLEKKSNKEDTFGKLLKQLTITDSEIVKNLLALSDTFRNVNSLYFPKDKSIIVESFKAITTKWQNTRLKRE